MNSAPSTAPAVDLELLAARIRTRRAVETQAIVEGIGDIVYDEALTDDERADLGLDLGAADGCEDGASLPRGNRSA